jgi:homoaconitate hydratase
VLEVPDLVIALKNKFGSDTLTVRTALTAEIDFRKAQITVDDMIYDTGPVGIAAQELIVSGGLENWVKKSL